MKGFAMNDKTIRNLTELMFNTSMFLEGLSKAFSKPEIWQYFAANSDEFHYLWCTREPGLDMQTSLPIEAKFVTSTNPVRFSNKQLLGRFVAHLHEEGAPPHLCLVEPNRSANFSELVPEMIANLSENPTQEILIGFNFSWLGKAALDA
jgi:hypothetical protein